MMTQRQQLHLDASALAFTTKDAYSFSAYGEKNWTACCAMLLGRGYNWTEVGAIMRSVLTRWATDRIDTRRRATAEDLADTMDNRMGGPAQLRDLIDDVVLALNWHSSAPVKLTSREALRLAWSRA